MSIKYTRTNNQKTTEMNANKNTTNQHEINNSEDLLTQETIISNININEPAKLDKTLKKSKFFNYDNLDPFEEKNISHESTDNIIVDDYDPFTQTNKFSDDENPFAQKNKFDDDLFEKTKEVNITEISKIEIWIEIKKGKKNTYVHDLEPFMDIETIKLHLKEIKKRKGCNGSITILRRDTGDIKVLQLQGNHKNYMREYLIHVGTDIGIYSDLIIIKGE